MIFYLEIEIDLDDVVFHWQKVGRDYEVIIDMVPFEKDGVVIDILKMLTPDDLDELANDIYFREKQMSKDRECL